VFEIDLLVFEGPPQLLDKDIIKDAATAVHNNLDLPFLQSPCKLMAGKLTSFIGVEDLGCGYLQGLLQS
jgi:hypothetical protein